jgi:photosystem II stability/assembly factor-like uncharacterized protein
MHDLSIVPCSRDHKPGQMPSLKPITGVQVSPDGETVTIGFHGVVYQFHSNGSMIHVVDDGPSKIATEVFIRIQDIGSKKDAAVLGAGFKTFVNIDCDKWKNSVFPVSWIRVFAQLVIKQLTWSTESRY